MTTITIAAAVAAATITTTSYLLPLLTHSRGTSLFVFNQPTITSPKEGYVLPNICLSVGGTTHKSCDPILIKFLVCLEGLIKSWQ